MTTATKTTCEKCGNPTMKSSEGRVLCHFCEKRTALVNEMRRELVTRFPQLRGVCEGGVDGR